MQRKSALTGWHLATRWSLGDWLRGSNSGPSCGEKAPSRLGPCISHFNKPRKRSYFPWMRLQVLALFDALRLNSLSGAVGYALTVPAFHLRSLKTDDADIAAVPPATSLSNTCRDWSLVEPQQRTWAGASAAQMAGRTSGPAAPAQARRPIRHAARPCFSTTSMRTTRSNHRPPKQRHFNRRTRFSKDVRKAVSVWLFDAPDILESVNKFSPSLILAANGRLACVHRPRMIHSRGTRRCVYKS